MHKCPLIFAGLLAACGGGGGEAPSEREPAQDRAAQMEPSSSGDWSLAARRQRALEDKPEWVLAEDLDGDGRTELTAATLVPGELLGLGAEGEPERFRVPVGDYPLRPLALPPGRTLLVASRADSALRWIDPLADTPELGRVELVSVPRAAALGDLGGDGTLEVVLACDGRRLVVGPASAPGTMEEVTLQDDLPRCLHVASDGSGVLVGYQSTRTLALHGASAAGIGQELQRVELGGIPRAICEGDLDGDGDPELLVAGGEEHLWIFGWGRAGGAATWLDAAPLAWHVAPTPIGVRVAGGEVYVLHVGRLDLSVLGQLTEQGPRRRRSGYAGQTPRDLAVADLDGDGRLEVAIANRDSRAISVVAGLEGGPAFAPRTPVGGFPNGIVRGDLNGDGRDDIVSLDSKSAAVSVLLAGEGKLVRRGSTTVGTSPRGARTLDLDGDGHTDLALLTVDSAGGRLVRLFGDGTGSLARRPAAPDAPAGFAPRDLLFLEGRFLVVDDERDEALVLTGEAGGPLTIAWRGPVDSGPCSLERVELDGDGGAEVAVALGGTGRRGLLLADLAGDQLRELEHVAVPGAPLDLAQADLDGGGTLDLVCLVLVEPGSKSGGVQPVFFDGAGGVELGRPRPVSLAPRQVVAADLDGDGGAEVLVAAQFAHVVDLFSCRGRELVTRDAVGLGVGPMALAVIDANGDGVPDLVGVNGHSDDVSLALGRR
ncbi:MAG: VCBS repeat-containing protein [Planctomycetota bacterium]|nr:VCBS repeat-containing protein [Planctomycetota bacterium]